jgi:hypothetical protein
VVDGHGSSFEHLVVKLLLGGGGFIWLFEADKGVQLFDSFASWV